MLADANAGSEQAPFRQRLSSSKRRAAIVATAVDLFARNGFRGTTTRELASAVGVSEPVLYQHFATKRELYTAIVEQMVAQASAAFDQSMCCLKEDCDDRTFFQRLGEIVLNWYLDESRHIRLLLFSALEGHDLADLWHQRATVQFLSFVESHVARRQSEGTFRPGSASLAARAFLGMVCQFGQVWTFYENPAPGLSREEIIGQFVDYFLNGVRRPAAEGEQQ
ncbi:MAG: TetR/AcrR family transcriptional regulator [Candidatus Solibacter usitatus]|nr:TetR/AcrR family transcriptional regulator [Candidatus Solibacter usitatus]